MSYSVYYALKRSILVIGGSGRVGGAASRELFTNYQEYYDISVGGRNLQNWKQYCLQKQIDPSNIGWESVDVQNQKSIQKAIENYDLIIHTAGPFQGLQNPLVMLARGVSMKSLAQQNNGVAVISAGIWPGVSSILAKKLSNSLTTNDDKVETLEFSFFTAGSGGAGPTILTATFLILGEDVLTYHDGAPVYIKTGKYTQKVDFGPAIGEREVICMNLIECESAYQARLAKTINTKFGTAPPMWNTLFLFMAKLTPQKILQNRKLMSRFASFSLPMVRMVDQLVGAANGIRVDCTCQSGRKQTALLTHYDLEQCVGEAIAVFAHEVLSSSHITPGIYFPEELPVSIRDNILSELVKTSSYYNFNY